ASPVVAREPRGRSRGESDPRARSGEARRAAGARPHARAPRQRRRGRSRPGPGLGATMAGDLLMPSEPGESAGEAPGAVPEVGVYSAPRPAVPVRLPVTPRFGGCASCAGVGIPSAGEPGFRRLPPWLKVKLPGHGEYAATKALLREQRLATV